ncbi:MAG: metallophosphoesterase [Caldilineaceae bacterium SB0664_bin_27]|uniref:Metallophosphoesterase n=1 Tax=Caldilineaceae bacterium SB0664_bin_27 TaxID=2605260 RepID=A0A6B0YTG3_9CHLR|nr:metallophosphoesterase [Caldilineaceae bacterium SB0664_bin_27]
MSKLALTRRRLLQLAGAAAVTGAAGLGYVGKLEPAWVELRKITITLPGLAERLAGFSIAQISDIHHSRFTSADELLAAVTRVNQLQPDIVALTGDFVGHEARFAAGLIEPLRMLEPPAFAVYGNHDLWTDREAVRAALAETPVTILVNQNVEAAPGLTIAGLDDAWSGHPRPQAALAGSPSDYTNLLLCHEPDYIDTIRSQEVPVALQLSGHSHGGQVRLPSTQPDGLGLATRAPLLPHMATRYPIGHYRVGNHQLYTNRGLGVWPLPFRFNCRPEITHLILQPA